MFSSQIVEITSSKIITYSHYIEYFECAQQRTQGHKMNSSISK